MLKLIIDPDSTITGRRTGYYQGAVEVIADGFGRLPMRQDIEHHADVLDWGDVEPPSHQLAVAVLTWCLGEPVARVMASIYLVRVVSQLHKALDWTLTAGQVLEQAQAIVNGKEVSVAC